MSVFEWLTKHDWLIILPARLKIQELLSDLDTAHAEAVLQCVRSRFDEIRHALVDRTNGISSTQLQDFNWQLKVQHTHTHTHTHTHICINHRDKIVYWFFHLLIAFLHPLLFLFCLTLAGIVQRQAVSFKYSSAKPQSGPEGEWNSEIGEYRNEQRGAANSHLCTRGC